MRPLALVALALGLFGCTSAEEHYRQDLDAIITPSTAALRSTETQLQAALAAASAHPPITPIALPAGAPPIDGRETVGTSMEPNRACNTIGLLEGTVLDRQLPDPSVARRAGFGPQYRAGETFAMLDGYRPPFDEFQADFALAHARTAIQQVTSTRYAVVCRTVAYTSLPPPSSSYAPASYDGECRLYDLPTTTYLGGVALHTGTHELETVWVGGSAGDAYGQLDRRMRDELVQQLDAVLSPLGSPEHAVWMIWG